MKIVAGAVEQFEDLTEMGQFVGKIIQSTLPRQSAYEEAITLVREKAAEKYEAHGLKKEAAEELSRLYDYINEMRGAQDARASQRSAEYLRGRVELCIHAARLLKEIGDIDGASQVLKRASDKVVEMPANDRSVLSYKLLNTQLFDLRHDFIRAAQKYIELARQPAVSHDDRLNCLLCCARCAVLAEAGPERANVLAMLVKDERISSLPCCPFLKKVHFQQILRQSDIAAFQGMLEEHQKVLLPGEKMTPLARAVMQHNLFSAANIYTSIRLDELGVLLGIKEEEAEAAAADMIRQKRINAKIDQIERLLYFNNSLYPYHNITVCFCSLQFTFFCVHYVQDKILYLRGISILTTCAPLLMKQPV